VAPSLAPLSILLLVGRNAYLLNNVVVKKRRTGLASKVSPSCNLILSFGGENSASPPPPLFITALVQFSVYVFSSSVLYPSTAFAYHPTDIINSCCEFKLLKTGWFLLHGAVKIVDLCYV
jgi:hypothetical protein